MILYLIAAGALVAGFLLGLALATAGYVRKVRELTAETARVVKMAETWNRHWEKAHNRWLDTLKILHTFNLPVRGERGKISGYESAKAAVVRQLKELGHDL